MKKIMTMAAMAVSLSAAAQDTYQSARLAGDDLNGTARYVGMGGAMEALGADLSTMGTNPAGIGMFRKSQASVSGGLQVFGGNYENNTLNSYLDGKKTTGSFDQIGFVLTTKAGYDSYLNFGFNYHKSKNFNQLLSAANSLNGASLNKVSFNKFVDVDTDNNFYDPSYSTVDWLNDQLVNPYTVDGDGKYLSSFNSYFHAKDFTQHQVQSGYIGDYDFNISGNIHNRIYLGLTFGIKDVNYESRSLYTETLLFENDIDAMGKMYLDDSRRITGTGFNVKFGAIVRPVDDSPFRIGAYVHTPTWYKLTTSNYTEMATEDFETDKIISISSEDHLDFRLNTPWLFGVSLGHTIGNVAAIGATYEYSDYGALDNRVIDEDYYYDSWYDDYYYGGDRSTSDKAMKRNTEKSLQGVHTLRLGAELKLCPEVALRFGYNYVSPKYSEFGCRDTDIPSQGVEFASTAAYTNWKDTNRFTCGIGYAKGPFSIDVAYKYSQTNGDFYPFYDGIGKGDYTNNPGATSVSDKRHQLLMTLGFRF